jgi:predicted DNA-binding transcriptional regulator YafY
MAKWTFLTKHALALSLISKQPLITAHELADAIGATERQIRRIIADLYSCGYIRKEKTGRGIKYSINSDLTLRHDTHNEIAVCDFLDVLRGRRKLDKSLSTPPSTH